jgi:hypothetical protein
MSGVIENGRACVGVSGLHRNNAYDLIADDSGPCYGPEPTEVRLRTLGYSSVPHVTLAAWMLSGEYPYPSYCDYIWAQTVQQPSGGTRGTYRYIHAQGSSNYWIDVAAGPGPNLPRTDVPIGSTSDDSDCEGGAGWGPYPAYHTHQDADSPYSTPNLNLPVNDDIDVWNVFNYIHKWTYPLLDTDGDGFTDAAENFMGTDPADDCADNSTPNNERGPAYGEPLSPWPPDFNDNGYTDIGDLVALANHWVPLGNPYGARYDLNANGVCDIGDLVTLATYWPGTGHDTCTVG